MASVTGSVYSQSLYGGSSSFSVTVPGDATCCIVYVLCGFGSATNPSKLSFDDSGVDFSLIAGISTNCTVRAYYMLSTSGSWPGSGGKTLYWAWNALSEDWHWVCFFVKDVDTSSPIVDYETDDNNGSAFSVSAMTGVEASDLSIVGVWSYNASSLTTNVNSQTQIYDTGTWSSASIAWKAGESTMQASGTNTINGGVVFALKNSTPSASGNPWYYYAQMMRSKLEEKLKRRILIPGFADCMRYGFAR